ncbi:MAG: alkaline phosphatase family protein [Planctomycetota bacterium]|nr:alkaline phosphatase family protein [Planctomycetota bacterium]
MTHQTVVINVVGLSGSLLGDTSPNLYALANRGRSQVHRLKPVLPAVTCSVQSSMLTGLPPSKHGIVGNGWYDRDLGEVMFWKQSNRLVQSEKVWETAKQRDPQFTCANMFWWYNMNSSADISVTPRPQYKADGRKIPDIHTYPVSLRDELQSKLGQFPLFNFWGPMASIVSSRWIADASLEVHQRFDPSLMLIYLPHLDYGLQKLGPNHPDIQNHVAQIDTEVGRLIDYFDSRNVRIILLSEYGIEPVDEAVHVNEALRQEGSLQVRNEDGGELLDPGASEAFAVVDHQIAHVYVKNPDQIPHYTTLLSKIPGVERVLDRESQKEFGIDHARAGDLILIASLGRWFTYDYWLDDAKAPDFARTVDIHRKPGYDPRELFLDPTLTLPKLRIAMKLLRKKLGFRTLMDVIPLDTRLVKGSHGRIDQPPELMPLLMTSRNDPTLGDELPCHQVRDVILNHLFED